MAKTTDTIIQPQRRLLNKRVSAIIKRFAFLNDRQWILENSQAKINKALSEYGKALRLAYGRFYTGPALDKTINDAERDIKKSLKGFEKPRKAADRRLKAAVKRQFISQSNAIVSEMVGRQRDKIARFKLLGQNLETEAEQGRLWKIAQQRSGKYDTVLYRNGAKFPLRQYTEMKSTTAANETHRLTNVLEAQRNQIYTGKISNHSASDSCRFHEGEIVFMSEEARRKYLKQFPNDSRAKRFKTVEQIEADPTHMFKPNCKHQVTLWPIQFFDEDEREKEVKDAPLQKLPKNPEKAAKKLEGAA